MGEERDKTADKAADKTVDKTADKAAPDKQFIRKKLKEIPELPGIYQMLDSEGRVIYIGKSKCLKKRVQSYFVESPVWEKAVKMAPLIYDINYIVADTHLEAMLLECEMIKSRKPHFNTAMKNDERYVYLTLSNVKRECSEKNGKSAKEEKPLKITAAREKVSFGPFRSRSRLQSFVDFMENLYPFTERRKKLQFEYHVFPVKITKEEWEENSRILRKLFTDQEVMQEFLNLLERKMKKAAKEQKFETAMKYRDMMELAGYVRKNLREYGELVNHRMIYAEETPRGRKYFYIKNGLVINKAFMKENDNEAAFVKDFMETSENLVKCEKVKTMTEKEMADYRDIVFSECRKMEKDSWGSETN